METLKCPRCGSSGLNQTGPADYKCPACGTSFRLTDVPTGFVDVVLVQAGKKPIDVIQALRNFSTSEIEVIKAIRNNPPTIHGDTSRGFDLRAAKSLTEAMPCVVLSSVSLEVGERFKAALEKAGATVELKPA